MENYDKVFEHSKKYLGNPEKLWKFFRKCRIDVENDPIDSENFKRTLEEHARENIDSPGRLLEDLLQYEQGRQILTDLLYLKSEKVLPTFNDYFSNEKNKQENPEYNEIVSEVIEKNLKEENYCAVKKIQRTMGYSDHQIGKMVNHAIEEAWSDGWEFPWLCKLGKPYGIYPDIKLLEGESKPELIIAASEYLIDNNCPSNELRKRPETLKMIIEENMVRENVNTVRKLQRMANYSDDEIEGIAKGLKHKLIDYGWEDGSIDDLINTYSSKKLM
jgi:hypothetical protein